MEIKNGYTGTYKNKHDGLKYILSAQLVKKSLQYYFLCVNKKAFKKKEPYKIDLEFFLRLISLGHFEKIENAANKKTN